ncbi:hypothetical protein VSF3289_03867 [Vibrio scophthalmi]|uniref:Uncharacterized protein n=1 Tax=Vibrio scophthalmi TaxID=45658 RepID=A0A1E3WFY2_9VIBR|nr:hypothetical protein VSF3289_03867 [Vibrio scophthalmi]
MPRSRYAIAYPCGASHLNAKRGSINDPLSCASSMAKVVRIMEVMCTGFTCKAILSRHPHERRFACPAGLLHSPTLCESFRPKANPQHNSSYIIRTRAFCFLGRIRLTHFLQVQKSPYLYGLNPLSHDVRYSALVGLTSSPHLSNQALDVRMSWSALS